MRAIGLAIGTPVACRAGRERELAHRKLTLDEIESHFEPAEPIAVDGCEEEVTGQRLEIDLWMVEVSGRAPAMMGRLPPEPVVGELRG